jgi:hypothetical protein
MAPTSIKESTQYKREQKFSFVIQLPVRMASRL